ncbi:uncharacterized protein LOC127246675 [Andrographis paniculata]|uniref:uncharacterized protein LOC127246675 n=1 Tax=Andrographis paniculata TaxID=175694 RepID=UPI0021E87DC5|nr:uncharacterized protein LOC127246675 [Andrographis paniculata]
MAGVNMEKFEEYFQRADLDRDGRISGAEAVAFLQGSNLPRQVLAQIWMHADQSRSGFLGCQEFYNALKLVTVAQSKRQLTPDIVKAALYGPASSKIPPPQIITVGTPMQQPSPVVASPLPQTGVTPQPTHNSGFRGLAPSNTSVNQQLGALQSPRNMNQQSGLMPSSTGMNQQFGLEQSGSGVGQQVAQMRPSGTMNQQFGQARPTTTLMNQQFGLEQSGTGMSQHFAQVQPSSTMNQQFGQAQPTSTLMNQQFGQLQPSNPGTNERILQLPPSSPAMNKQPVQFQLSSPGVNQQVRQAPSSMNSSQNFLPSQGNHPLRQSLSMPGDQNFLPPQGNHPLRQSHSVPGDQSNHLPQSTSSPNVMWSMTGSGLPMNNNVLPGGKTGAASTGPATPVLERGVSLSNLSGSLAISPTYAMDSRRTVSSGNLSTLDGMISGGLSSANNSPSQHVSSPFQQLSSSSPTSSVVSPVTSSPHPSPKPDPFEALRSTLSEPSKGIQASQKPSLPKSNQQTLSQVTSGFQAGVRNSTSEQSQISWPKMTGASIQKYAKVFMEVDSDRDGKITGDQARNLFLSWRLPREVLKQVWDLADQDSDSMLSLREFCIALYLMERHKEGHSLPAALPQSVMFSETLSCLVGPPTVHGNMGWDPATGLRPQQAMPNVQPITPTGVTPPMQPTVSQPDVQFNQKNARGSLVDNSHLNQSSNGEVNFLETKGSGAEEANEKVDEKENVLLDSREKLEFYRTNMQDLVLYKSRCDNRLNEITERARADKSEAELLEKKYQEKYKQVAEIHSKLAIEEAAFREVQERKMELQQAITKMEQGGSADGILQVRADRIQSDLEELLKALADRCKKHSIEMKLGAIIELPAGWQPIIPEAAAIWDKEWDKFEDDGFSLDVALPAAADSKSEQKENPSPNNSLDPSDKLFGWDASVFDTESVHSADESRSPHGSPGRQTIPESPYQEYSDNHFRKSFDGDAETQSFDDPSWGNFDNGDDDIDSVWGFNAKVPDHEKQDEKYFFGSNDFSASPDRGGSPNAESPFQKKSAFTFEDSFPESPLSRANNSPRYSVDSRDQSFDKFTRFDSFNSTHDAGSSSRLGNLTRFDSVNSPRDFGHSRKSSFDDSDPFGSSGPFKASS